VYRQRTTTTACKRHRRQLDEGREKAEDREKQAAANEIFQLQQARDAAIQKTNHLAMDEADAASTPGIDIIHARRSARPMEDIYAGDEVIIEGRKWECTYRGDAVGSGPYGKVNVSDANIQPKHFSTFYDGSQHAPFLVFFSGDFEPYPLTPALVQKIVQSLGISDKEAFVQRVLAHSNVIKHENGHYQMLTSPESYEELKHQQPQ
jgi:hypothetical protein